MCIHIYTSVHVNMHACTVHLHTHSICMYACIRYIYTCMCAYTCIVVNICKWQRIHTKNSFTFQLFSVKSSLYFAKKKIYTKKILILESLNALTGTLTTLFAIRFWMLGRQIWSFNIKKRVGAVWFEAYKVLTATDNVNSNYYFHFNTDYRTGRHKWKLKNKFSTYFRKHLFIWRIINA